MARLALEAFWKVSSGPPRDVTLSHKILKPRKYKVPNYKKSFCILLMVRLVYTSSLAQAVIGG